MVLKFTCENMDNMTGICTGLRLWVSPEIYKLLKIAAIYIQWACVYVLCSIAYVCPALDVYRLKCWWLAI